MTLLIALLGVALAGEPTDLVTRVSLGATPKTVAAALEKAGAERVKVSEFNEPGAFNRGALAPPSMLAMLNRAGVKNPFFDKLPKAGPTFVSARIGDARAAYAFVSGKLWSMAATLPYRTVKPKADPFARDRTQTIDQTLGTLCRARSTTGKDDYGNPVAWRSTSCQGGTAHLWYEPHDRDAAVKIVVHGR
jgi:hypothetical protein